MAGVASVENFQIVLATGAISNTYTLTKSQTASKCVPLFFSCRVITDAAPPDDFHEIQVDLAISGSTVTAKSDDATARAVLVEGTIVEYGANVTVQSGTYSMSSGTGSDPKTITGVTLANSFLVHTFYPVTSSHTFSHHSVRGRFTSTTGIEFDRDGTSNIINGHWWVVEADSGDFTVQELTVTVTGFNNTGSITGVTMNKSHLVGSYKTTDATDDCDNNTITAELTATDTVTITRAGNSGTLTWTGYVISYAGAGAEKVQRGKISSQTYELFQNVPITAVTLSVACTAAPGVCGGHTNIGHSGTASDTVPDAFATFVLTSTTNLRVTHGVRASVSDTIDIAWEVVELELDA